jgi:glutamate formiminotransferase/formiminotetrahydrofolate cyclodeaminase
MQIVECVPNISEGRSGEVIDAVVGAAAAVDGVSVLDVDPGQETNRTVITFVGDSAAVVEGAFQLIVRARQLIDMREHSGAHPRQGAVDVVPFVPVSGVTMDDCVELARRLGERVGNELELPVFLYELAATRPERRSLASCREGEYESLAERFADPSWEPDFGPARFDERFGAVAIGARKFLVAYNVDLNVIDKRWANRVAFDVREKGRTVRAGDGTAVQKPGLLEAVRGLGWFIPEYGRAQVSMNLVDLDVTPVHVAFDTCEERAQARGMRVTGSEIVGLIPREAILEAGRHYLHRMGRSRGVPERDLVHSAALSLGLNDVAPFDPQERVIEYRLAPDRPLVGRTIQELADETSRDSAAPGGGSVAAVAGALAAALASMVANLPHPKSAFAGVRDDLEAIAIRAQELKQRLLDAVDDDTWAFERLMDATRHGGDEAVRRATLDAARIPLGVAEACPEIVDLCERAGELGLAASVSDAAVGAAMARAAAVGAALNVRINLQEMTDDHDASELLERAETALRTVERSSAEVETAIWSRLGRRNPAATDNG